MANGEQGIPISSGFTLSEKDANDKDYIQDTLAAALGNIPSERRYFGKTIFVLELANRGIHHMNSTEDGWEQFGGGGGGDVFKVGVPVSNQIGVWTGDGTIEGVSGLTYENNVRLIARGGGVESTVIGPGAASSFNRSVLIGHAVYDGAVASIAIGSAGAGGSGISIGAGTQSQSSGISIGNNISSVSPFAITIGVSAASGVDAINIGQNTVTGTACIAIGSFSRALNSGASSYGRYSGASALGAIMMGNNTSLQINSLGNSFELNWAGITGFKVGLSYGTGITTNANPDNNLTNAVNGVIAYDTTDNHLRLLTNSSWQEILTRNIADVAYQPIVTGTPDGTKFLGDDNTWKTVPGGGGYTSWNLLTNGVQRIAVVNGGNLDLVAGTDMGISYSAGGVVTINYTGAGGGIGWSLTGQTLLNYPATGAATFNAVDGITNAIDIIGQTGTQTYDFITQNILDTGRTSTGDANFLRFQNDGVDSFKVSTNGNVTASSSFLFGDGDTGFVENSNNIVTFRSSGSNRMIFYASGLEAISSTRFRILNAKSTRTLPNFIPNKASGNTGLGGLSGELSLTISGVEAININSSLVTSFYGGVTLFNKADPDPTGVNGMLYYNSTTNKIKGYENGAWINLSENNAAGLDGHIQFNDSGVLGTNVNLGYDTAIDRFYAGPFAAQSNTISILTGGGFIKDTIKAAIISNPNSILIGQGAGDNYLKLVIGADIALEPEDLATGLSICRTGQKLSFFGEVPIVRQTTTSQPGPVFVANSSSIANNTATWNGYSIGDLVVILQAYGLLT